MDGFELGAQSLAERRSKADKAGMLPIVAVARDTKLARSGRQVKHRREEAGTPTWDVASSSFKAR